MDDYFRLVSDELLIKLKQARQFIKKHNPTIGILTEEILRTFLRTYLPKSVSIEQGFIVSPNGILSKQCDILIYDSNHFSPLYRINDIVIVPTEAVLIVIEVKTTITKAIFHNVIDYFTNISSLCRAKTYLFIYEACDISKLEGYFHTYKHKRDYQMFDHDTYQLLPAEITGINNSYHLKQSYVCFDRDTFGYESYFYENEEGKDISAFELFYISIYKEVENYNSSFHEKSIISNTIELYYGKRNLKNYFAIELFDI
ncbi:hypothetical protein EZS27_028486 [termite gut metagenome]|uniref:DUF6602 domain-containing protein n=1 Tax=termite gut metagenome TaxID=433724 RepID=A0A5J4QJ88_9ZZZZ